MTLRLKRTWWQQLEAGVKTSEFRINSAHNRALIWSSQLWTGHGRGVFDEIHFWLGYPARTELGKLLRFAWLETRYRVMVHPDLGGRRRGVWEIVLGDRLA